MHWLDKVDGIRAIVLDIDGVMTDGRIGFTETGTIKFFDAGDGHAIKMAMRAGLLVGTLSGRSDPASRIRCEELDMSFIYLGEKNKSEAFDRLLALNELKEADVLYVGDDLVDIPVVRRAGVGLCVANAAEELVPFCDGQTERRGGHGAVREIIVSLLKKQGHWERLMERYVT
jgi:3-deoxy-D-manno-octulosonate 8-phosphate phosphatase (KDO 8-P phosphatase)